MSCLVQTAASARSHPGPKTRHCACWLGTSLWPGIGKTKPGWSAKHVTGTRNDLIPSGAAGKLREAVSMGGNGPIVRVPPRPIARR